MDTIGQADMSGPGSFCTPDHTFLQFDGKTVASIQSIASGHDEWIPHVCVDARAHDRGGDGA